MEVWPQLREQAAWGWGRGGWFREDRGVAWNWQPSGWFIERTAWVCFSGRGGEGGGSQLPPHAERDCSVYVPGVHPQDGLQTDCRTALKTRSSRSPVNLHCTLSLPCKANDTNRLAFEYIPDSALRYALLYTHKGFSCRQASGSCS